MSGLPAALKAALDAELEGVSRKDLAIRAAATSAAYRAGGTSAATIKGHADALAYALARLPATYAAGVAVLAEAQRLAPGFAPTSLLDAGAGPGGGSWAAAETWGSLRHVTWLDANPPFLALAERLAAQGPAALRNADARRGDLVGGAFPSADLVLASYALAEIAPVAQARVVEALWGACDGVLVLVEPGTPAGYARVLAARDALIAAGATIVAPCPHHAACPLVGEDWCHFSVRLPRSRDHMAAKGAEVPFEDERYAYVVAARAGVTVAPRAARVLAPPRAGKPGVELKLCGTDGALEPRFVERREKAAWGAAKRLGWGDRWSG